MTGRSVKTAIRVISMPGSERRETFHRPPPMLGLDFKFFDATTGVVDGLCYDEKLTSLHCNRQLVQGEVGVYGSHVRAWRELLGDPSLSQMIIFEDDVFADWNFFSLASRIDWSSLNIEYLKFFAKMAARSRLLKVSFPIEGYHLVEYLQLAAGAQAYLITPKTAERFEKRFRTISRPIDVEMDSPWATGIPVLGLLPHPAMELLGSTTIRNRDESRRKKPLGHLAQRVMYHAQMNAYPFLTRPPRIPYGSFEVQTVQPPPEIDQTEVPHPPSGRVINFRAER